MNPTQLFNVYILAQLLVGHRVKNANVAGSVYRPLLINDVTVYCGDSPEAWV